jgi:hypothetical protein
MKNEYTMIGCVRRLPAVVRAPVQRRTVLLNIRPLCVVLVPPNRSAAAPKAK